MVAKIISKTLTQQSVLRHMIANFIYRNLSMTKTEIKKMETENKYDSTYSTIFSSCN